MKVKHKNHHHHTSLLPLLIAMTQEMKLKVNNMTFKNFVSLLQHIPASAEFQLTFSYNIFWSRSLSFYSHLPIPCLLLGWCCFSQSPPPPPTNMTVSHSSYICDESEVMCQSWPTWNICSLVSFHLLNISYVPGTEQKKGTNLKQFKFYHLSGQ